MFSDKMLDIFERFDIFLSIRDIKKVSYLQQKVLSLFLQLAWAEEVAYTCYMTFARQPTFLAAEITYFNTEPGSSTDFYVKPNDSHYLLRPETIESLWYLYYVTGNKTYQDWGWKIFQVKSGSVQNGLNSNRNVCCTIASERNSELFL